MLTYSEPFATPGPAASAFSFPAQRLPRRPRAVQSWWRDGHAHAGDHRRIRANDHGQLRRAGRKPDPRRGWKQCGGAHGAGCDKQHAERIPLSCSRPGSRAHGTTHPISQRCIKMPPVRSRSLRSASQSARQLISPGVETTQRNQQMTARPVVAEVSGNAVTTIDKVDDRLIVTVPAGGWA